VEEIEDGGEDKDEQDVVEGGAEGEEDEGGFAIVEEEAEGVAEKAATFAEIGLTTAAAGFGVLWGREWRARPSCFGGGY
jgi:hypothetical protein